MRKDVTMEKIVALAKNRGFVFPGSEIYGGLANTWDYGPLGVEFKNNVKKAWWRKFVQESKYNVGLDAAILMNPKTWVASGHVGGFSDPLIDCKECKSRHRADKLIEEYHMVIEGNGPIPSIFNEKGELSSGVAWMKDFHVNNSSFEWFGVTKLTIGEGITSIPYAAFVYGLTLDSVILPSSLNIIEKEAFGMCVNLTEITIPNSVESIGSNCFVSCSNLITIYYNGTATGSPWGASNATVKSY